VNDPMIRASLAENPLPLDVVGSAHITEGEELALFSAGTTLSG
jgi:hypothetical protein